MRRCASAAIRAGPTASPIRLSGHPNGRSVWFHIRRMADGRVSSALGRRITPGHRVKLTGPYGSAHFRPDLRSRLILVATNTGFAPIWSVATAALRENPQRRIMVIAGGRTSKRSTWLPRSCSSPASPMSASCLSAARRRTLTNVVLLGRPTDYLPRLLPTDVLYACGAPGMVDQVRSIAAHVGAVCYADPFLPATGDPGEESVLTRAMQWIAEPTGRQLRQLAIDRA